MSMQTAPHQTLGSIVADRPYTARVFEALGLDYCCGGSQSLAEACRAQGLEVGDVERRLAEAAPATPDATTDWARESLSDLIEHILHTHHAYTREAIERLRPLMEKVHGVHSARHPELTPLRQVLDALGHDLEGHLMKEERILFPYILGLEQVGSAVEACFGTVASPIQVMRAEHDEAGDMLRHMRKLTDGYSLPEGACASYRALYQALEELELDLHRHIHLENNILFPRAIQLEATV